MTLPRLNFTSLSQEEVCGDIVKAFRLAVERLGYPTSYTPCYIEPGAINILFFFWDIPWSEIQAHHPDCIIVNFEPMVPGTHAWSEKYLDVLKRAYVWEYSKSNFQRNLELGYRNADYVALGWEPDAAQVVPLADILPEEQQDIDVVFFGSLTRRRIVLLETLIARGLRVELTRGRHWTLEERNDYVRRAKLVLNFHNWEDSRIVEVPRLSILMRHRKAVVCELYPDSEIEPWMREAVVGAPYERLVEAVEELLADAPRRAVLEREGLDRFTRPWAPPLVGPAIERFLDWRAQQANRFVATELPRVSVCLALGASPEALSRSLQSLAQQRDIKLEVVLIAPTDSKELDAALATPPFPNLHLIQLPVAFDRATARNMALAQSTGDYLVFLDAGDVAASERLQRQVALLETRPTIDIVGCWCETDDGPLRFAERHQDIVAEYLGPQPLLLSACMVRRAFLERSGVRHDPEFTIHDDLHLLCKSAAAGARFAVIPEVLHTPAAPPAPADPARAATLAMRARALVLAYLLPQCSGEDVNEIAQLYAHLWPPTLEFAEHLLGTLASACLKPSRAPGLQPVEHETLTRALRHEALRLLQVFFNAGLADKAWLERQFALDAVAAFLAPAANQLPVRVFRN
ncbi:glycosyltransferase family 2 protein [Variovorax sp. ZS18.2.2]|uniref:glycosyltransferase family A protein n=1 Tax=Variovorax sp. ZS18.2.2 TaxID=2971255 RepID=UPI002150B55E|nr:glycosyltransferase family A protein [Variovorax sp. ZS18.2.2]MCR6479252.1 glycosyltransferase family 2 protein [Variovorax sp. ZS18.2.2]